jgi:ubiquinone/menaquinone biosynthesis C-methylase UbiE
VDFTRLGLQPGVRVLDLGCGAGRHAFEALRRGASVLALDADEGELNSVAAMFAAMREAGEVPPGGQARALAGDATAMPLPDASVDVVIAAEVLEHIPADQAAIAEIARVLRPGGLAAVTVPAWLPERVCWALSADYHNVPGGHVRIFTRKELTAKLAQAGLAPGGHHHAHALHPLARAYHRMLVWDLMQRPALTQWADRALNPLIGKSLVVYAAKPEEAHASG